MFTTEHYPQVVFLSLPVFRNWYVSEVTKIRSTLVKKNET